jgi:hypothetical protein
MASPAGRAFRCIFYRRMPLQSHDAGKWMVVFLVSSESIYLLFFASFLLPEIFIAYGSNGILLFNQ